jgi:hypothetical protein
MHEDNDYPVMEFPELKRSILASFSRQVRLKIECVTPVRTLLRALLDLVRARSDRSDLIRPE